MLSLFFLNHYIKYGQENREAAGQKQAVLESESGIEMDDNDKKEISVEKDILIPHEIRIRIMNQDFQSEYHETVALSCENGCMVSGMKETGTEEEDSEKSEEENSEEYGPEEVFQISASELPSGKILCIEGRQNGMLTLNSITRGDGTPEYGGKLYLEGSDDGILVINELPLEEYLCGVVSSEMPADYPAEALKAQAVCARTYAVNQCAALREMNDSVSFQVYNNYRSQEASRNAVKATEGEVLPLDEIQYFSTSCLSEHEENLDTNEAFETFLAQEPGSSREYGSPWLRWSAKIPVSLVLENLAEMSGEQGEKWKNKMKDKNVKEKTFSVSVTARRGDGQIQEVLFDFCGETFLAQGEYQIRKLFGGRELEYSLMDESVVSGMQLLPSAYFYMDEETYAQDGTILVRGGGYGHGNGMSQCGAAQMASEGLDYHAILMYYYGIDPIFGKTT